MGDRIVFVGGLPKDVSKQEIKQYFSTFGELSVNMHTSGLRLDRRRGISRGFCFLTFDDPAAAEVCLQGNPYHVISAA